MDLIDDLKRAAESEGLRTRNSSLAIDEVRRALGVAECNSFAEDLANVLLLIAERVEDEYVPVPLDADGNPVEQGEEYYKSTGERFKIVGYRESGCVVVAKGFDYSILPAGILSKRLPDTQGRIDADKKKLVYEYWGCNCWECDDCPAVVEGKRPFERFGFREGIAGCGNAMGYDLAMRQAKLAAPKGAR